MNNTKELTPTEIASMSEVVAKYMGLEINKNMYGDKYSELPNGNIIFHKYIPSWNRIHEVWEKVREDEAFKNTILYDPIVSLMAFGNELQCFTALFEIITFINKLKQ